MPQARRGFRQPPKKLDPSRNMATERGRPVTAADVRPHAKMSCARCRGRGYCLGEPVCRCAQRGFLKAHPEVVVDERGMSWWPSKAAGASQAQTAATTGAAAPASGDESPAGEPEGLPPEGPPA